jgi:hypothetical protein
MADDTANEVSSLSRILAPDLHDLAFRGGVSRKYAPFGSPRATREARRLKYLRVPSVLGRVWCDELGSGGLSVIGKETERRPL